MRITLVISSLGPGGAERVISNMANHWAKKCWSVTLITLAGPDADFYLLERGVSRISLRVTGKSTGFFEAVLNNCRRVLALRRAIRSSQPDVVISFIDSVNILTLLATRFTAVPVIIAERIDPRWHHIGKVWEVLRRLLYPKAAALVVQTQDLSDWAVDKVGYERVFVIPNSIALAANQTEKGGGNFPQPFILAVGRLEVQKGFDLLLRSFANVSQQHPEWSLVILGEGSERTALEALAKSLGIEARVSLPGRHINPVAIMAQASTFVLSSRFEGFPNVLLEAMACGTPSISFDCASGPREIIRHGVDGLLVPPEDTGALADAMQDLMAHPERRERLAFRAHEVAARFSVNRVLGMWEDLLNKILSVPR